jgi:hypothetical protein
LITSAARPRPLALAASIVNHDEIMKTRSLGARVALGGSTTIAPLS